MKKRRFNINGQFYDIPDTEVSSFLSDNPHAQEVNNYNVGGKEYNVPIHEADAFESDMGIKKKEATTLPSTSSNGQSTSPSQESNIPNPFDISSSMPKKLDNSQQPLQFRQPVQQPQQPALTPDNNFGMPSATDIAKQNVSPTDNPTQQVNAPKEQIQKVSDTSVPQSVLDVKNKKIQDAALDNATEDYFKGKKIDAPKGSALYNEQRDNAAVALKNGLVTIGKDANGNYGLNRQSGFWENLKNSYNHATQSNTDNADFVNNWNTQQRLLYLKLHPEEFQKEPGFIGQRPDLGGSVGNLLGGGAPLMLKTVAGATVGAGLAAIAPETGGFSLAALPAATAFAFTAPDFINGNAADEIKRRFQILKSENPQMSDEDAMDQADAGKWAGGATGLATAAAFSGMGVDKALSTESKGVIANAMEHVIKPSLKIGGITGAATAAAEEEGNLEGVKTSQQDIFNHSLESLKQNGVSSLALMGLLHYAPKILSSAYKYALVKDENPTDVQTALQANEDKGIVPQGTTQQVTQDIHDYADALKETPNGLKPEAEASYAGLVVAKKNLQKDMLGKDKNANQLINQPKIDAIDKQLKTIITTNKSMPVEVDETTGKNYAEQLKQANETKTENAIPNTETQTGTSNEGTDKNIELSKEEEILLAPHRDSPVFMGMNTDAEKLKYIADQSQNVSANGEKDASGLDNKQTMLNTFGEPLVKAAIEKFPAPENKGIVEYKNIGTENAFPISELNKMPKGELHNSEASKQKLKEDISKNGIKEPLTLLYYVKDNALRIKEGHHRLDAANKLGLDEVPVKVQVEWNKSIKEDSDIEGQKLYHPPHPLDVEGYKKRNYEPTNIDLNELGYKEQTQNKSIVDENKKVISGFHSEFDKPSKFTQKSEGTYISLDEPFSNTGITGEEIAKATKTTKVETDINPEKIFDPENLLAGTKTSKSETERVNDAFHEAVMKSNVKGGSKEMAKLRTEVLKSFGYEGEAGAVYPDEAKSPRELIVFDKSRVKTQNKGIVDSGEEKNPEPVKKEPPPNTPKEEVKPGKPEEDVTSIKNAVVDKERKKRGLEPAMQAAKKEFGETWDNAMKTLENNPNVGEDLVNELKQKARPLTDEENAILLHRQIELQNAYDKTNDLVNKAADEKDLGQVQTQKLRRAALSDALQDVYNVGKAAGTEQGRGLATRKMLAKSDFSLASMETQKRAANDGRPLTDEERTHLTDLSNRIKDLETQLEAHEKKIADLEEANKKTDKKDVEETLAKDVKKEKLTINKEKIKKDIAKNIEDIKRKLREQRGRLSANPIPVELIPDIAKLAKNYVRLGINKIEEIVSNIHDALKDEVEGLSPDHVWQAIEAGTSKEKLGAYKKSLIKSNEKLETKVESAKQGIFPKKQEIKPIDKQAENLTIQRKRLEGQFRAELEKDRLKNLSTLQKGLNAFVKWQRAFKLSSPLTLAKLTMAAIYRTTSTPLEEAVGGVVTKLLPKGITKEAYSEAGFNVKAEAKALTAQFTQGMKDSYATINLKKGGKSDLEVMYGKQGNLPPEAADFLGHLHGALKAPVKRAAFERSFEKQTANMIKAGIDVTYPLVQTSIGMKAYQDAQRSIFMQDNAVSTFWQQHIVGNPKTDLGKFRSSIAQFLVPFAKVPTNIVGETVNYSLGVPIGAGKLARALIKGTENIEPQEKEQIVRLFKKGLVGAGFLMIGYANPNAIGGYSTGKRKTDDVGVGGLRMFGMDIPQWLVHNPLMEQLQIGATVRRVADNYIGRTEEKQGIVKGVGTAMLGLTQEVPFVNEAGQINKLLGSDAERAYFADEMAKNTLEPAVLQSIAKYTDSDVKRKPEDLIEHLKMGIPGLREQVSPKREYTKEDLVNPAFKYFTDRGMSLPYSSDKSIKIKDPKTYTIKSLSQYPEEVKDKYYDTQKKNLSDELMDIEKNKTVYVDRYGQISTTSTDENKKINIDDLSRNQMAEVLSIASRKAAVKTKEKLFKTK